jgi:hypothetical protein
VTGIKYRLSLVVMGAALLAAAPAAAPRTYKWVDNQGVTHYSQSRPPGRQAEEVRFTKRWTADIGDSGDCDSLSCRAARLASERRKREQAARDARDAAAKAAAYPVFPTHVEETHDEKISRLVAECKSSRGSDCDSDAEKRRMLLQNVELTHAERRALRGLSPARQRRALLQRIPKQYRDID